MRISVEEFDIASRHRLWRNPTHAQASIFALMPHAERRAIVSAELFGWSDSMAGLWQPALAGSRVVASWACPRTTHGACCATTDDQVDGSGDDHSAQTRARPSCTTTSPSAVLAPNPVAVGAVRTTARRVRPCGCSRPRCVLEFWNATSIDQRMAYQTSTCSGVASWHVEQNACTQRPPVNGQRSAVPLQRCSVSGSTATMLSQRFHGDDASLSRASVLKALFIHSTHRTRRPFLFNRQPSTYHTKKNAKLELSPQWQ